MRVADAVHKQLDMIDCMVTRIIVGSITRPRDSEGYICDRGAGESAAPCMLDLIPILKDLLAPLRAKPEFAANYSELQAAGYSREESELANKWHCNKIPQREYLKWVWSEEQHRIEEARHDQRQHEVITAIRTAANSPTELVSYNSQHVMLAVSEPCSFFKKGTEAYERETKVRWNAQDVDEVFASILQNAPPASLTTCIRDGLERLKAMYNDAGKKRQPTPAGAKLGILHDELVRAVKLAALYKNKAPQGEPDRHDLLRAMSADAYVVAHDMSYADAEDLVKTAKSDVHSVARRLLLHSASPEVRRVYITPPEEERAQPVEEGGGAAAERADGERFWHRAGESHAYTMQVPHACCSITRPRLRSASAPNRDQTSRRSPASSSAFVTVRRPSRGARRPSRGARRTSRGARRRVPWKCGARMT